MAWVGCQSKTNKTDKETPGWDGLSRATVPDGVAHLLDAAASGNDGAMLRGLVERAIFGGPAHVDEAMATRMVWPYAWLLERLGVRGVHVTAAGRLPPEVVEAAASELGMDPDSDRPGSWREDRLPALHELRFTAAAAGLIRRDGRKLVASRRGRLCQGEPQMLWRTLATAMPLRTGDASAEHAGLLLLIVLAADIDGQVDAAVAELMGVLGWVRDDGQALEPGDVAEVCRYTRSAMRLLGAWPQGGSGDGAMRCSLEGVAFARVALRLWPSSSPPVRPLP